MPQCKAFKQYCLLPTNLQYDKLTDHPILIAVNRVNITNINKLYVATFPGQRELFVNH